MRAGTPAVERAIAAIHRDADIWDKYRPQVRALAAEAYQRQHAGEDEEAVEAWHKAAHRAVMLRYLAERRAALECIA